MDEPKIGDKVSIGGIECTIASEEECEQSTIVVCGPTSYFPDDVHTTCAECGTPVVHRPYAPKTPPKVCMECAGSLLQAAMHGEN